LNAYVDVDVDLNVDVDLDVDVYLDGDVYVYVVPTLDAWRILSQ
jgi:hypothetical protein